MNTNPEQLALLVELLPWIALAVVAGAASVSLIVVGLTRLAGRWLERRF